MRPLSPLYDLVLRLEERLKKDGTSISETVFMGFLLLAWAMFTAALGWYVLEARVLVPMFAFVLAFGANAERRKRKMKKGDK